MVVVLLVGCWVNGLLGWVVVWLVHLKLNCMVLNIFIDVIVKDVCSPLTAFVVGS